MEKASGDFGKLVANYKEVRPNYPHKVIQLILKEISGKALVLDLGCGTGIGTRQIAKKGSMVIGCDIDQDMLGTAIQSPSLNVSYIQGAAEHIPFSPRTFDAITIFNAFHWFKTKKALSEIKRVLKPDGVFVIIQRTNQSLFRDDFRTIVERILNTSVPPKYNTDIETESFLTSNKFKNIHSMVVKTADTYTLDDYLRLLQSYSLWNDVPESKRQEVLKALKKHFTTYLTDGCIVDRWDISIIFAYLY